MTDLINTLIQTYHTQEALARALGVSNQTVWRWLHGVKPSALALRRMRELLASEEAGKEK